MPGLRTRSNFIRVQVVKPILASPSSSSNSLVYLFTSSGSSSTKISFFKFKFRQMNIQKLDNFVTAGAHVIKKIKYFARAVGSRLYLSCLVPSKLSVLWSQLNNKLYFVVIFYFFSTI